VTVADGRLEALTNDGLLQRNVLINLVGWSLPAIAALISLPLLARGLGPARFGLVALTWSAVGIFSQFDFGLGRALTRIVAERLAVGNEEEIHDLVWAATWLLLAVTGLLAVVGCVEAPAIVDGFLHVPIALRAEAVGTVRLLALAIPPLAHGVALRGVLEAGQRFRLVNMLRVPLGIATYAGPLIAIPLGLDARIAVGTIVLARAVYWLAHFFVLNDIAPHLARPRRVKRPALRELAAVGGWITVSQVISPIIVQADRLVVAAGFPIAASGYYGTAAEVATKQWLFTAALQPVFYSAMAAAIRPTPLRAAALMERAARITLLVLLPAAALLAAFAEPLMRLWMRGAYSAEAAAVLRWLAIAVYVNAVAQVPYSALQGGVDARGPALLHMCEFPIYVGMLIIMARVWGLQGVAVAWLLRMAGDALALWWLLHRGFPEGRAAVWRLARLAAPCLVILGAATVFGLARAR
jgi:O-antigen/teichoic acid export membrane protein